MLWERVRAGLVSGIVGFAPLVLVILLTRLNVLSGDPAITVALLAFPLSILLSGGPGTATAQRGQGNHWRHYWLHRCVALWRLAGGLLYFPLVGCHCGRYAQHSPHPCHLCHYLDGRTHGCDSYGDDTIHREAAASAWPDAPDACPAPTHLICTTWAKGSSAVN
jgi:hypothetical protein